MRLAPVSAEPLGVNVPNTRHLQATLFGALVLTNLVLALGPFLLKSGGTLPGAIWLAAAAVALFAGLIRSLMKRRPGSEAAGWIHALRPAVLGTAIVLTVFGFIIVILPLVALAAN